ncbi:MAG TPA: hypothetical protein VIS29_21230 [Streptomyces sp.]|jgi:hypothetical protein
MATRIALLVIGAALVLAAFLTSIPSQAEVEDACRKALDNTSTATHRPEACEGVSAKTYNTFLLMYALRAEGLD